MNAYRRQLLGRAVRAASLAALPFFGPTALSAQSDRGRRPSPQQPRSVLPNVPLLTHSEQRRHFYDDLIAGRRVLINVMYTACSRTCPPATATLLEVQALLGSRLGRDIFMYSLTLQPDIDTPSALAHYAHGIGARAGWTFLTGESADVDIVRRSLGFYDPDPEIDADPTQHTGMVRLGYAVRDRWSMTPSIAPPEVIVARLLRLG